MQVAELLDFIQKLPRDMQVFTRVLTHDYTRPVLFRGDVIDLYVVNGELIVDSVLPL
jgi:hypothetical protein